MNIEQILEFLNSDNIFDVFVKNKHVDILPFDLYGD